MTRIASLVLAVAAAVGAGIPTLSTSAQVGAGALSGASSGISSAVLARAAAGLGPVAGPVPTTGPGSRLDPAGAAGSPASVAVVTAPGAAGGRGGWAWPLAPPHPVLRGFDPPDVRWGAGHRGVDLGASVGAEVLAPADGVVSFTGLLAGRPVLVVTHPGGLRSTFEPVVATLPAGSAVARGSPIGVVDATAGHCAPVTCVHWGVLRGTAYLDPLALLSGRVILLPLR